MKKRAIGEITGPYRFMQLIWIVLAHPEYDWDVVVRYVDGTTEAVDDLAKRCEMSGLFKNVIKCTESTLNSSFSSKVKEFIKLGFYFVTFRKQKYFDNVLANTIGSENYDVYCAENSFSILGCAMMHQHKRANILILEDGSWDYANCEQPFGFVQMTTGKILFYLGLINCISRKNFKLNKYCIKYATRPEMLLETNFRQIRKLYDNSKGKEEYKRLIEKIYQVEHLGGKAILFGGITQSKNTDEDINCFMNWVEQEYEGERILVKTHPQDTYEYKSDKVDLEIINKMIPGELFLNVLDDDTELVFMSPTTMMMSIPKGKRIRVTHFSPEIMFPTYQSGFEEGIRVASTNNIDIVELKVTNRE